MVSMDLILYRLIAKNTHSTFFDPITTLVDTVNNAFFEA